MSDEMRIISLLSLLERFLAVRKASHLPHGQGKRERVNAALSADGKEGLTRLADQYQLSVSEFLEQIGRGQIPVGEPGKSQASG